MSEKGPFWKALQPKEQSSSGESSDDDTGLALVAFSGRRDLAKKESKVSLFDELTSGYQIRACNGHRVVRDEKIPLLESPMRCDTDVFKNVLFARLEASRSDIETKGMLLKGLHDMTPGQKNMNYSWVFNSSVHLKNCSTGDDYVQLNVNSASGTVVAADEGDKNTDAAFYAFVDKVALNVEMTVVLFPYFLYNFLEHFTLMFFSVTLGLDEVGALEPYLKTMRISVGDFESRIMANMKLWTQIASSYVHCINYVKSRLGNKHTELHILCLELRREIMNRIDENSTLIMRSSSWELRFDSFREAVLEGMSMREYVGYNSTSLAEEVIPAIMAMTTRLSIADSKMQKQDREIKSLRGQLARVATVAQQKTDEDDALLAVKKVKRGRMDRT